MSQSLTINDREYIPAGEVGRHFGYTRDYILTLSRDGKIDGRKVGHRWYVNLDSAKTFFESAQAEREVRRQVVSEVRKAELRSYQETTTVPKYTAALTETFAILIVGLLIGVTGYLGTTTSHQAAVGDSGISFFKQLAISVYDLISPQETHTVTTSTTSEQSSRQESAISERVQKEELSPIVYGNAVATTTYTSLVIGPEQVLTTTTVESIRDSFSDEVSVSIDPHDPDTGIVIPHFKNGDGESYRFFMVPVTPQENQN